MVEEMAAIEMYTKSWCGYCRRASALLRSKGVEYEEIDVTSDAEREREMIARSQRYTVPQIFVDGKSIGGYDDLARLDSSGELDRLLGRDRKNE
jgi:GrxC family glutaredoxin